VFTAELCKSFRDSFCLVAGFFVVVPLSLLPLSLSLFLSLRSEKSCVFLSATLCLVSCVIGQVSNIAEQVLVIIASKATGTC
jgi:hypothetical protein